MTAPKSHRFETTLPAYETQPGILPVREHEGTVWIWADPRLILWQSDVVWLFSPVSGETVHDGVQRQRINGDLWGLDEDGQLLIVENKLLSSSDDPFDDLCSLGRLHDAGFSKAAIETRWRLQLRRERSSIAHERERLAMGPARPPRTTRGVLPYSSKREALYLWPRLYEDLLALVERTEYSDEVERRLRLYEIRSDRRHAIGLFTIDTTAGGAGTFVPQRSDALAGTVARFGVDCVHLRSVAGHRVVSGILVEAASHSM